MTRLIRLGSIVLAACSVVAFAGSSIYAKRQTDYNGPEIQVKEQEIAISIEAGEAEMLAGVTAKDKKDGDVTKSLLVESMGAFVEKGKRQISIAAFDSDQNVAKGTRTIVYQDYVSPRISLKKPLRAPVNNVDKLMEGMTVTDCLEGDITENVQLTPEAESGNVNTPGEYKVKLIVANNAGDVVELPVTVELYDYSSDSLKPLPILSQYLVYTKVGEPIDPMSYLVGTETKGARVTVDDSVDYGNPGTYEISFTAKDGNGREGTVRLIVVVEE